MGVGSYSGFEGLGVLWERGEGGKTVVVRRMGNGSASNGLLSFIADSR